MAYERLRSIGGSDVGAILGINNFQTPAQVWDRIMGHAPEREDNHHTLRGRRLELPVMKLWEHVTGRRLLLPSRVVHPTEPFHYTPDGGYKMNSLVSPLETKVPAAWAYRKTLDEGVDPSYYAQLQHGIFLFGADQGSFAIMCRDLAWVLLMPREEWDNESVREEIEAGFVHVDVPRDDEWLEETIVYLTSWWRQYIEGNTRPPEVVADNDRKWPKARVGAQAEDWRDNAEFNRAAKALMEARTEFKLAEHAKERAEAVVKELMGETEVALSVYGKISWKEGTRRDFDHKALLEEHPEFASYYRTSTTRTLRPSLK